MNMHTLDAASARGLVDRIKTTWQDMSDAIVQLWEGRGWPALDYDSWDDLCAAELNLKLQLPMMARRSIVGNLSGHGMSTRAIGSALGVDPKTVVNDRRAGVESSTPAEIIGTDGKRYRMEPPREPESIPVKVTIAPRPEPAPPAQPIHIERVGPMGNIDRVAKELCTLLRREPARRDSPERRELIGDLLALIEDRRAEWDN
jgi:hypothetical protein